MDRRTFLRLVPAGVAAVVAGRLVGAAQTAATGPAAGEAQAATSGTPAVGAGVGLQPIVLPKPEKDGGKSVMAALWERKTNRNISEKKLPAEVLGNLLWAAFGVNRPSGPRGRIGRTAASASNSQEIDVYVALAEGTYLYEAAGHRLAPVAGGDLRGRTSRRQGGAGKAPVGLIYVADLARFANGRPQEPGLKDPEIQKSYYNICAGMIAQNVYLFAASQGLAVWFHNCDKAGLAKELNLRANQHVLYAHTVGYPAGE